MVQEPGDKIHLTRLKKLFAFYQEAAQRDAADRLEEQGHLATLLGGVADLQSNFVKDAIVSGVGLAALAVDEPRGTAERDLRLRPVESRKPKTRKSPCFEPLRWGFARYRD